MKSPSWNAAWGVLYSCPQWSQVLWTTESLLVSRFQTRGKGTGDDQIRFCRKIRAADCKLSENQCTYEERYKMMTKISLWSHRKVNSREYLKMPREFSQTKFLIPKRIRTYSIVWGKKWWSDEISTRNVQTMGLGPKWNNKRFCLTRRTALAQRVSNDKTGWNVWYSLADRRVARQSYCRWNL